MSQAETPQGATCGLPDASHAKDAERGGPRRRVERSCEVQSKHAPRIGRVDDAIVPQPRGCKVRRALAIVPVTVFRLKGLTDLQQITLEAPQHSPCPISCVPSRGHVDKNNTASGRNSGGTAPELGNSLLKIKD